MRLVFVLLNFCFTSLLVGQVFTSSTLPLLVIDTEGQEIPDEPKIMARLGIVDNGPGQVNRLTDAFNDYAGWIGIERRGSTSQAIFPKIGYSIETRTVNAEDLEVSLLGFPQEEDWVLHGPYSDKSLIRNALGYSLAGEMMNYAPRVRLVELFIDNDYRGVYLFTERIKRDNDRVDIAKMDEDDNTGDALTGGYIFKFDKNTGETDGLENYFISDYPAESPEQQPIPIFYHYPKPEDITTQQKEYLQNYVRDFENALAGPNFQHPTDGYRPFVDLPSFVDYLIINEVTRNVDGYRLSSYFHKDRDSDGGGLLHAGPIWDLNLAFGNADYCNGSQTFGWAFEFNLVCPWDEFQVSFWWRRLREDPAFLLLLRSRWLELRANLLATNNVRARIDALVAQMGDAPNRNFQRWPSLGEYVWPNHFIGETYTDEINYLKQWVTYRLAWLDAGFSFITSTDETTATSNRFAAYPNPSNGPLTIQLPQSSSSSSSDLTLQISDFSGRIVSTFSLPAASDQVTILPELPSGYYVLTLIRDGQLWGRNKWLKH